MKKRRVKPTAIDARSVTNHMFFKGFPLLAWLTAGVEVALILYKVVLKWQICDLAWFFNPYLAPKAELGTDSVMSTEEREKV